MDLRQLSKAVEMAMKAHSAQKYGDEPYWVHLDAVAKKVVTLGGQCKHMIVAWLHDILEDTNITEHDLRAAGFDNEVVTAVILLTKVHGYNYAEYIAEINENPLARLVKLADTLCNLEQSLKEDNQKRVRKYAKQVQLLGG